MQPEIRLTLLNANYLSVPLFFRGGTGIKPALIRFGEDVAAILKRRPAVVQVDFREQHEGEVADNAEVPTVAGGHGA